MACKGFIQCLLKIINFLFALIGLAMIGYGIYMVVIWNKSSSSSSTTSPPPPPPPPSSTEFLKFQYRSLQTYNEPWFRYQSSRDDLHRNDFTTDGDVNVLHPRRALLKLTYSNQNHLSSSFWSSIPSAWFLYCFIAVGVVITILTCSGYIAAVTANGCCLSCYSVSLGIVMIIQLALGGFIFFDGDWKEVIPNDSTGELESIETFIEDNIKIFRWVALGAIVLQAFTLFLTILLRALSGNADSYYDSDDEFLDQQPGRQPLLNRQTPSTLNANAGASDNRPVRADAWSTRMREKYGLDTKEFSYNPLQQQQQPATTEVKKGWCTIM